LSKVQVPQARGKYLKLPPHPLRCQLEDLGAYASAVERPLAIDLFCGGGGLSLGLELAGFAVVLGVDKDRNAVATHRAHFAGASLCADLSDPDVVDKIVQALQGVQVALVAGGPPCQPFSRAGRNKILSLVRAGARPDHDPRRELWRSFVDIVDHVRPQALMVENVPEMAVGSEAYVLRQMVAGLEGLGYHVHTRILATWQYGVPQHRQRLIIVGVESGRRFAWPEPSDVRVTVRDAISDLPVIQAGASQDPCPYHCPRTPFQERCRAAVAAEDRDLVHDHFTRHVRDDDLEAFRLMDHETKYSDLPRRLRRYGPDRPDIFDDKYKRLNWDDVSRTITAHISKDGYWYIHPEQHRTLSVREAARLQTFPDSFRFAGFPTTNAFRQIGEAVPPFLAEFLGVAMMKTLDSRNTGPSPASTSLISARLAEWFNARDDSALAAPWRRGPSLWLVVMGLVLFEKLSPEKRRALWRTYAARWPRPEDYLQDELREAAIRALGQGSVEPALNRLARALVEAGDKGVDVSDIGSFASERLALARTLCGIDHHLPLGARSLRVAERVFGGQLNGCGVNSRLLAARLVGAGQDGQAYAGLLEVGEQFCLPSNPDCPRCPLEDLCQTGRASTGEKIPSS